MGFTTITILYCYYFDYIGKNKCLINVWLKINHLRFGTLKFLYCWASVSIGQKDGSFSHSFQVQAVPGQKQSRLIIKKKTSAPVVETWNLLLDATFSCPFRKLWQTELPTKAPTNQNQRTKRLLKELHPQWNVLKIGSPHQQIYVLLKYYFTPILPYSGSAYLHVFGHQLGINGP